MSVYKVLIKVMIVVHTVLLEALMSVYKGLADKLLLVHTAVLTEAIMLVHQLTEVLMPVHEVLTEFSVSVHNVLVEILIKIVAFDVDTRCCAGLGVDVDFDVGTYWYNVDRSLDVGTWAGRGCDVDT